MWSQDIWRKTYQAIIIRKKTNQHWSIPLPFKTKLTNLKIQTLKSNKLVSQVDVTYQYWL